MSTFLFSYGRQDMLGKFLQKKEIEEWKKDK